MAARRQLPPSRRLRILLTDGSGLTSRQVATIASDAGHEVEVLSPDPMALTRFTRTVRHVHRVPPYWDDPIRWLDAALEVAAGRRVDVLFPTQEQVAALAAADDRVRSAGIRTVVPPWEGLVQVQDKLSAHATLSALGLPQPPSTVARTAAELGAVTGLPAFVKLPIGTASRGVARVGNAAELARVALEWDAAGCFDDGGVVVQEPVDGPLAMVQSVFAHGVLVAFHATLRVREGASGGASHKRSVDLAVMAGHLSALGSALAWHGALSMDVMLDDRGPWVIDVNPRLVEPVNAWRSGVDLVAPMLELALDGSPPVQAPGRPGVATHQGLLAVLGAAAGRRPRRAVLHELGGMLTHNGDYRGSTEELTPPAHDWRTLAPVVIAATSVLVHPGSWRRFSSSASSNYALSPEGWRQLIAVRSARGGDTPVH